MERRLMLYLDSCVVIDYVERHPSFFARIKEQISAAETRTAVSDLTRLECLVQPLRQADAIRLKRFRLFFGAPDLTVINMTPDVFDLAAELRARHALKTPDALHLAAAIEGGCDEFWTNDSRLDAAADAYLR
ncbi:MAG: type II toxin-antitoxin system VapC family toxin, partial [Zoogloeaceae bacterium]|nr:type II toxin-antitoxin system VapC family toxin [Zoogloeaceae bacterium]